MIECENCGNTMSDGYIIKSVAVIQINYKELMCNVKCRKCKTWTERIPLSRLIKLDLIKDSSKSI